MDFPPEHYFQTASERMRRALYLNRDGASYALAIYVGGVAVECMLRAFKGRRDPHYDEKHDLLRLFRASGMLGIDRAKLHALGWTDEQVDEPLRSLRVAVNEIYRIWANNYRFASEMRLRAHLKKLTSFQRIRGDSLKEQARQFLNSAEVFVDKGVVQWQA